MYFLKQIVDCLCTDYILADCVVIALYVMTELVMMYRFTEQKAVCDLLSD